MSAPIEAVLVEEPPVEVMPEVVRPSLSSAPGRETEPRGAGASLSASSGECCSHCQAPSVRGQNWCRRCGFYPTLGTFVEVEAWEKEPAPETVVNTPAMPLTVQDYLRMVPRWGWRLLAGAAAIFVVSLLARFLVPAGSPRAIWTWAQFGIGLASVLVAHVACYMFAIMVNDQLGAMDIALKPWTVWKPSFDELPESFRRVAMGSWGVLAMLTAFLVVGGVKYDDVVDWGKVPPKKNLLKAITEQAQNLANEGDMEMKEAMEQLADKSGANDLADDKGKKKVVTKSTDCLIIGFTPNREDDFSALIIATERDKQLVFVGTVSDGIPYEVRKHLNQRMRKLLRSTPFVKCDLQGFWIEPKLICTIKYEGLNEQRKFTKTSFDELLAEPK